MQDIFHQEIYVQAVPPGGAKYQISAAGGAAPMWRREGKELFYISADRKLTAVSTRTVERDWRFARSWLMDELGR